MVRTLAPIAYSYLRFSSPEQAKGDSVRRQEESRDAWIKKAKAVLDTSLSLADKGVSAFTGGHRTNPDRHALAAFLDLVKRGRIQRGSYLIVENLDRLSREDIRPALTLLLNLIDAGIRVVQLLPAESVFDENVEPMMLMMAIMELSRGHSESRMKSERVGAAWAEKKRQAAKDKGPVTKRTPAWLSVEDGGFVILEDKAATVRRIYDLAIAGLGIRLIAKKLNTEGVPPIAAVEHWGLSSLSKLLSNRATMGEYQPYTRRGGGKRRQEGKPIPDYFPAVISENTWHAAQAAMTSRKHKGGRPTPRLNLFGGLLRDARDGGTLHQTGKGARSAGAILISSRGRNGIEGARCVSFPADVFEAAVLSCLREIDPREILPEHGDAGRRLLSLSGKLTDIEGRIEKVKAELLDGGELAPLVEVLRSLEAKRAAAAEQLAEAEREAASPISEAWGEARSLVKSLDAAPDPDHARLRLRSAIRRITESVWCLFVARGASRLAAVQIWFAGGACRHYLILHKPRTGGSVGVRPGRWWVRSLADVAGPKKLDLRVRDHAKRLEKALAEIEVKEARDNP